MNSDQLYGQVRTVAAAAFGVLVGKGWIDAELAAALSGVAGVAVVAVWSFMAKRVQP